MPFLSTLHILSSKFAVHFVFSVFYISMFTSRETRYYRAGPREEKAYVEDVSLKVLFTRRDSSKK